MQSRGESAPTVVRTAAFERYCEAVNTSFVPLQVSAESPRPFSGALATARACGAHFTEVDATPQLVTRTAETIERGGSGFYKVSVMLSGSSVLIQDGREAVMRPGDISFYDTSRPYSLLFEESFRDLVMMYPKDRLMLPSAFADSVTAVSLREKHPLSSVVADFIGQASPQLRTLPPATRTKLAHASIELMTTLLSAILDVESTARDPHEELLQKINAYIDANLGSPDLSPRSIAAAHFISLRHLYALFAEHSTSVSRVIRDRRLECCRADLSDPRCADQPVARIAGRWGFVDPAHFSRVFKKSYGISPRDLRPTPSRRAFASR
ncbi:helix-turn-helix domain-containing protein [uncultured Leifsonia sp.]|uniref:AraC-like ligand-binding domain-containing protein n=1 Tax=uncultured Leifsonia sp. TaxID=340359 RepID=UPI0028D23757|nr:helix-turn-helix domain-containing protein [uncultured Leifsonia sp.]